MMPGQGEATPWVVKRTWPRWFRQHAEGTKRWEIRREDDWYYQPGDVLVLAEYCPDDRRVCIKPGYSGLWMVVQVERVDRDLPGLQSDYALLGTTPVLGSGEIAIPDGMADREIRSRFRAAAMKALVLVPPESEAGPCGE